LAILFGDKVDDFYGAFFKMDNRLSVFIDWGVCGHFTLIIVGRNPSKLCK
jgi:hypothetical protein